MLTVSLPFSIGFVLNVPSQSGFVEPGRPTPWPPWNWKNISLPCSRTEALYSIITPVLLFPTLLSLNEFKYSSYSHARLLEINSHSLFSKWFSESGKLVQRLFNSISELIEEEDGFIVVLIGILLPIPDV